LAKALRVLGEQTENARLQRVILEMSASVESGKNLSSSMSAFADVFNEGITGVVRAGEISGRLNTVLGHLADQLEKSQNIRGKLKGAMTYPAVIFFVLAGVMFLAMTMIVPKITEIFKGASVELPLATQILIVLSDFLVNQWWVLFLGIIIFTVTFIAWKKTPNGSYMWDKITLRLPVFGLIKRKACLANFARTLSMMISSGVPMVKGLQLNAEAVGSETYKEKILMSAEDVKQGIPIAQTLEAQKKYFPPIVVHMIAVGEQTAQLDKIAVKIAEFYDMEVDDMAKNISALLEPIVIVVIGISVGGLVAAIMQPIMKLSEVASGS
jgi:type IV pilus assembly protein PilC